MPDGTGDGAARGGGRSASIRIFAPVPELRRRFDVRRVLGSGERASSYVAFDRTREREVALKVLKLDRPERRALSRFRAELPAVQAAAPAGLVPVLELVEAGDSLLVVGELAEGEALSEGWARTAPRPAEAAEIARQVAEALAALHAAGALHRNLNPGNVFLEPSGRVRLADWGLPSRWERGDGAPARPGERPQVAGYLSPEQALGEEADVESDLYSLGALLHELLTGRVPLQRETPLLTAVAHVKEEVPDVRRLSPEVPAWLAAVVRRLLARDPDGRYASAAEVAADLAARRAPRRRLPTRQRVLATAAAAAALVAALLVPPFWPWNVPHVDVLAADGEGGGVAVEPGGLVLWSRPDVLPGVRAAIVRPSGARRAQVAAVLGRGEVAGERARTLAFLEGDTGVPLRTVTLPGPPGFLAAGAAPFRVERTEAVRLSPRGPDAVLVVFGRSRGGSYAVLHEPADGGSRVVWASPERHGFAGASDLDGDGERELLFSGANRPLGGYVGLAAVRAPVSLALSDRPSLLPATSPDVPGGPDRSEPLWYALVPAARDVVVDPARASLGIETPAGRVVLLGPDGFYRSLTSARASGERQALRRRAYGRVRDALALLGAGRAGAALEVVALARRDAESAGDPTLAEAASRLEARSALASGQVEAALLRYRRLVAGSEAAREVASEAAFAFHLAGRPREALGFYETGLFSAAGLGHGRERGALLSGAVLALAEGGRYDDARALVDRAVASAPEAAAEASWCRAWLAFLAGQSSPTPRVPPPSPLQRYWSLEIGSRLGEPGVGARAAEEELLGDVPGPLLLSIEAERRLLAGEPREAFAAARRAWDRALPLAREEISVRGGLGLLAARLLRAAEGSGRLREASEVTRQLAEALRPSP